MSAARRRRSWITAVLIGLLVLTLTPGRVLADPAAGPAAGPAQTGDFVAGPLQNPKAVLDFWTPGNLAAVKGDPLEPLPVDLPGWTPPPDMVQAKGVAWEGDFGKLPASSIGRIFSTRGNESLACTATVIQSEGRNLILTAAHCLQHDGAGDQWAANILFLPGLDRTGKSLGMWPASRAYVPSRWMSVNPVQRAVADVAIVVLATDATGRHVEDVTGGQRIDLGSGPERNVHLFGYSADPQDERVLSVCTGETFESFLVPGGLMLPCDMGPGASGGPYIADLDPETGIGSVIAVQQALWWPFGNWKFGHGARFHDQVDAMYEALRRAGPTSGFVPLGESQQYTAGVQVQNLEDEATTVRVEYVSNRGEVEGSKRLNLAGHGSATVFDGAPAGFRGAVRVARTDATAGRIAVTSNHLSQDRKTVSSSAGFTSGSRRVLFPLLMNEHEGMSTFVSVQNVTGHEVTVWGKYANSSGWGVDLAPFTLRPGAARLPSQEAGFIPKGVLSGELSATGDIVATVFEAGTGKALYEYTAFPAETATLDPAAPLVMADNYGTLTGIQIMNPGTAETRAVIAYSPNAVRTTDRDAKAPCSNAGNDWRPEARAVKIPAGASVTVLQRGSGAAWNPGNPLDDPSFANCRYIGSARITADDPVVAVVNQVGGAQGSAYEAVDTVTADGRSELPLIQANNPASSSGIQIQNLLPETTWVTLTYSSNAATRSPEDPGPDDRCPTPPQRASVALAGNGTLTLQYGKLAGPDEAWSKSCRYVGSVTITTPGTSSIATIANQVSNNPSMTDQLSTYVGS